MAIAPAVTFTWVDVSLHTDHNKIFGCLARVSLEDNTDLFLSQTEAGVGFSVRCVEYRQLAIFIKLCGRTLTWTKITHMIYSERGSENLISCSTFVFVSKGR